MKLMTAYPPFTLPTPFDSGMDFRYLITTEKDEKNEALPRISTN